MTGQTSTQIKGYNAEAAITKHRVLKHGAADGGCLHAAGAADRVFGVSWNMDSVSGKVVDVHTEGQAKVEYGGTVARGDALTSDASGRAVATTTTGDRVIGFALKSGVIGDIGLTSVEPGIL